MIQLYGIPQIFDMIHFEHNHKAKVKGPFAKTTQNFGNIDSEMLRKLESATIIIDARDTSRRIFNKKQEFEDRKVRLRSTSFYKPAADITYEAYMTKSTTQRLYYVVSVNSKQEKLRSLLIHLSLLLPYLIYYVMECIMVY